MLKQKLELKKGAETAAWMLVPVMSGDKLLVDMNILRPDKCAKSKAGGGVEIQDAGPKAEALRIGFYGKGGVRDEVTPSGTWEIEVHVRHKGGPGSRPHTVDDLYLATGDGKKWIKAQSAHKAPNGGFLLTELEPAPEGGEFFAKLVFAAWPKGDPLIGWDGGDPF